MELDVKSVVRKIEELLNTELTFSSPVVLAPPAPPHAQENPAGGGRVMYVPLPGTGGRFKLSPRAQQVFSFLSRNRKASPQALQAALHVNRNVIAGAVHELKQVGAIRVERMVMPARPLQPVAADYGRRATDFAGPPQKPPRKRKRRRTVKR